MLEIVIHKKVARKFEEVEKGYIKKIENLFETLKTDAIPWRKYDVKKIEGEMDTYRIRIGVYRLVNLFCR